MHERKDNPFIIRMRNNMKGAIEGMYHKRPCAEEIRPMIENFFQDIFKSVDFDETNACGRVERITEIVRYLAEKIRNDGKLTEGEITSISKIFNELKQLHTEVLNFDSKSECNDDIYDKIVCIQEIVCKNMAGVHESEENPNSYYDGMLFQSYENLWKVVNRVNTEWKELNSRGFNLSLFYDYYDSFLYDRRLGLEKSEDEKFKAFMLLLDGKMKFVPIYEHRPVCFKVVDNDFKGNVVNTYENKYSNSYRMRQKGEFDK